LRFTRLRLNGFKSFVDPTDLVIHEGLTGVVGPNGCGKSNLLEALRWVMGENRPTAMRGDGMEDVIFAGAATRPARISQRFRYHRHRVAGAIGFQRSGPARRAADHGDAGRPKANARDVRARDVQMLFADASNAAFARSGPAGQIAELSEAQNRRRILEAAGISGLPAAAQAELKLQATEQIFCGWMTWLSSWRSNCSNRPGRHGRRRVTADRRGASARKGCCSRRWRGRISAAGGVQI
jgi:chromosome segregation protein